LPDIACDIDTPSGPARASLLIGGRSGLLCLGHGAGGGVGAPDLAAVAVAAAQAGWTVALVEQPYRVAGKRAPAPAPRLDAAWAAVVASLRGSWPGPLVCGGRSSGGRVACRTAAQVGADGVVCLAFPLRPPQRPEQSRAGELLAVEVPLLVVQGRRDPFGGPDDLPPVATVVAVDGDHSLRNSAAEVAASVADWLRALPPLRGQRVT
jgi:predicted alpha/beta-hydrolase family hydrolase